MIYITEQNLRDLYGKQPFKSFTLVKGERLTPGARQFLSDRQIVLEDPTDIKPSKTATIQIDGSEQYTAEEAKESTKVEKDAQNGGKPAVTPIKNGSHDKLKGRFCALEALYLKQATEIYAQNQNLANEIFDMETSLCSIEAGSDLNILAPLACNGMNAEDLKCPHRECFHMTRAILLANHGAEAAMLHYLRSETYRFYCENAEELTETQKIHVAYLINLFSQMIHRTIGGTLCQKLENQGCGETKVL